MIKIKSPVTWIGNKTSILHILYALFPIGCDRYVEPFGGSGAVLLGKPVPDKFEVFNDYNHNLVNLFRCMRDRPMEFIRELGFLSLNSRDDFAILKKFFEKEEFTEDYLKAQLDLTEILLPEVTAKEARTLYSAARNDHDLRRAAMFLKLIRYSYSSGCKSFACQPFSLRTLFKGISGTSVKNRDEFNRMIRRCKQGKIDMIITKSIARFARNTVDCLKYVRLLNDLGVDVYFEEQGIHSNQPGAEFYITIYGSIAQSESENISANIKWGKAQAAREGKVVFRYKNFLGYRKGDDGQPEIVPEEAETIRLIYDRFLAGDSLKGIAKLLEEKGIKSPTGKAEWQFSTIQSILSNERYKGDAIINKTYITDCISKKVRVNNGERPKYYVENSHPAIIDSATFGRVQEELARRSGKRKISRKAKTEQGKYSSKYALTELLVCGECKSAYRRCTWTASGKKKIVWRCINRIEYAKKYCHNSPSVEESILQRAVMAAIMETANQNAEVLRTLKTHIGMGLAGEKSEDNSIDLQIRIAEIDAEFKKMLDRVSTDTIEAFDEETATRLMNEKSRLQQQLDSIADAEQRRENAKSRLDDIYMILDGIKNRPMEYDDQIVRQLLECVVVDSKEQITVIFKGGLKSVQPLTE